MAIYDLYGCLTARLEEAKNVLEATLDIRFESHESAYQGGNYFRSGKTNDEHFVLKRNLDLFDNEAAEMPFSEYPILFYVNGTSRSFDLQQKLLEKGKSIVLLRHEVLVENQSKNR
jgi:hypothetical protein